MAGVSCVCDDWGTVFKFRLPLFFFFFLLGCSHSCAGTEVPGCGCGRLGFEGDLF